MTTQDDSYQGRTNWDTWNANLWLTNEEGVYREAMECIDEFDLNDLFESRFQTNPGSGVVSFIDGIDPDKVNWAEIFASLHEGGE